MSNSQESGWAGVVAAMAQTPEDTGNRAGGAEGIQVNVDPCRMLCYYLSTLRNRRKQEALDCCLRVLLKATEMGALNWQNFPS